MKFLHTVLWSAACIGGLGMLGCDITLTERREGPVFVQQQEPQYVVVQQAPPPLIVESRPPPPSEYHIWIEGYWNWSGSRYVWVGGRYERPPQPDVIWVAPRYEVVSGGTRIVPGHWDKGTSPPGGGRGRGR